MRKLIVIHPRDHSTAFLRVVYEIPDKSIEMLVIQPDVHHNAKSLEEELKKVASPDDIILFLGHGRSDGLYGSLDRNGDKVTLLSREEARTVFAGRNTILFSCHSNSLFRRIGSDVGNYVGFGSMPTDWLEIRAERDIGDYKYLSSLTNKSLNQFRDILVKVLVTGRQILSHGNFSRNLYLTLRLELNKAMLDVAENTDIPIEERIELFKVIQTTKNEIVYKD